MRWKPRLTQGSCLVIRWKCRHWDRIHLDQVVQVLVWEMFRKSVRKTGV